MEHGGSDCVACALSFWHAPSQPLALWFVEQRLKSGKERPERISERFGLTKTLDLQARCCGFTARAPGVPPLLDVFPH